MKITAAGARPRAGLDRTAFALMILLSSFALSLSAQEGGAAKAEGGGEAAPLEGEPAPLYFDESAGLPSYILEREHDPSRDLFESGKRLFAARRFGEALLAFRTAVDDRRTRYAEAGKAVDAILAEKDTAKARDSLSALFRNLAKEDLIDADLAKIEKKASGSLRTEAELLRPRRLSTKFADLLDAFLLVTDRRPAASLKDSLKALSLSCEELKAYPEAELWIGKVYLAEGEQRLAELQFQRAYTMRASLDIAGERFAMLEELAALYKTGKDMRSFEACLSEIAQADPLFGEKRGYLRTAMESILGRSGLDMFLKLYRAETGPWTRAERELGEFYLESGRPQAIIYLAVAADANVTAVMRRIVERDPSWEYSDLASFLDKASRDRELMSYLEAEEFGKTLHELGLALDSGGHRESARGIWKVLAQRAELEPWNRSSAKAFRDSSKK